MLLMQPVYSTPESQSSRKPIPNRILHGIMVVAVSPLVQLAFHCSSEEPERRTKVRHMSGRGCSNRVMNLIPHDEWNRTRKVVLTQIRPIIGLH